MVYKTPYDHPQPLPPLLAHFPLLFTLLFLATLAHLLFLEQFRYAMIFGLAIFFSHIWLILTYFWPALKSYFMWETLLDHLI